MQKLTVAEKIGPTLVLTALTFTLTGLAVSASKHNKEKTAKVLSTAAGITATLGLLSIPSCFAKYRYTSEELDDGLHLIYG